MALQPENRTTGSTASPLQVGAAAEVGSDAVSLSVLMPVYNAAPYLPEAIESILAQTFGAFEFVIVDDGSTDASPDVLSRYVEQDARIRVVRQQNAGIVGALNRGLAECRGALVARMDADDRAMPDRLDRQMAFLAHHPEVVAVGSAFQIMDSAGEHIEMRKPPTGHHQIEQRMLLGDGWALCHPTVMMRRDALERVGGYSKQYEWVEDVGLFLALARVGRLANLSEPLLCYRRHNSSVSATKLAVQKKALFQLRQDEYRARGMRLPRGFHWNPPEKEPEAWHLEQGWAALKAGRRMGALKHAMAGAFCIPWSAGLWKMAACAVLNRTGSASKGGSRHL